MDLRTDSAGKPQFTPSRETWNAYLDRLASWSITEGSIHWEPGILSGF